MKLSKTKQKLLDEAYNTVIQVCLFDGPLEDMAPLLAEDVMNFGAGKKELTQTKTAFLKQIKNQKKLAKGLKMDFAFTPVLRKIMNEGNGAIYTDDIVNTVWVNNVKNELKFRLSFIFEYREGKWFLVHSHTSAPDPQRTDDEVWPIEDLKKRTEFLEQRLEEKVAELSLKNRELEVEAALERVRSKTMAMHNSQDVGDTVVTLFDEVLQLGLDSSIRVGIGILEGYEGMETWSATSSPNGKVDLKMGMLDMTIHPMLIGLKKAWESKKEEYTYDFIGADVLKYYTALNNDQGYPFNADLKTLPEKEYHNSFFFSSGILFAFAENPISVEAASVLNRFANVFGQTYRRFLDLQKAEQQSREAQIETALEKVRASSMAMHKSEELKEVIQVVYGQFSQLNLNIEHTGFIMDYKENEDMHIWLADKKAVFPEIILPYFDCAHWNSFKKAKKKENNFFTNLLGFEEKNKFYEDLFEFIPESPKEVKDHYLSCPGLAISTVLLDNVGLYIENFQGVPYSDEDNTILMRFGKVFQQTYTRFLDLQKAESQAREAQIETALEKVRASSMAMHKSEQLPETAQVLFEQFALMGNLPDRISICIIKEEENLIELWATDQIGSQLDHRYSGSLEEATTMSKIHKAWKEGKESIVIDLSGQKLKDWVRYIKEDVKLHIDDSKIKGRRVQQAAFFSKGLLLCTTNEPVADEIMLLLTRFAKVFDQTYTRFLDLQKAEAQAREATKQASLDRVRGQIASMRTAADLERITPLVWNELTTMNVPFIRCGVFIIDEPTEIVEVYLSAPDGHSLGVLHLQFNANPITANTVAHWRKGSIFKKHWNREEFINWTRSLMEQGQISDKTTYQGAANPPDSLNLHFIPFTQGMLYVGSENSLNNEQIELVQSLADTFAIAYARYEDFTKLEKAKQSAETTLSELKTTQNQLVQSEKMASLGELTAGIAHEIQNPLNFVNNFSEVSVELIEEMHEELEKGDLKEAQAIAEDVKQNLDKITHHGKRADGIVKGMLQHSRSSSGQKEPTDINVLADEYLRLAYHGLRAKDKTFSATMETDFDESIDKINVIPQDIGRVILNLITNAFYVVSERKLKQPNGYEPTVSVKTKKNGNQVLISVKDNGKGIPQKVLEKIFQPFFTTKPTGEGTGLGLSMSYDIVKAHGGELKVETNEGEGSQFIIILPV